jgi:Domain of unknown function (DUF5668)/Putative adhesin
MSRLRPRGSSLFTGSALILVGMILLLHNYHGFDLGQSFRHWWPLILIVWGAIKLYERSAIDRVSDPTYSRTSPGEVFLVLGLFALVGIVIAVDYGKNRIGSNPTDWGWGNGFDFPVDAAPRPVSPDSRILIHTTRGDITVRGTDSPEIRVSGTKSAHAWNENDAKRITDPVSIEIIKNADGYEIRPAGGNTSDSRLSVDMEVVVPSKSSVTIKSDKGDITVSSMATPVTINSITGDVEVRDNVGDVSIDSRKGDIKVSDTKGNVKISGHGDQVDVTTVSGTFTLDGDFYGPIRAERVAKGVRFVSARTDLTLTQLTGHMEAGTGNMEIVDAPGNVTLRSEDDVTIENAGGKLKVDNRKGNVELRFSEPPKEDIDITNSSASISLSLPGSSSFDILADSHSGDIDSEFDADSLKKTNNNSGDAHLEGKYGSARGPKITLKNSYGSISIHKTS